MREAPPSAEQPAMERLIEHTRVLGGSMDYNDDFSIVEFQLPPPE
jgi:sigma-B regulation protein RsbU (phosphoserine phosphatase)